MEQLSQQGFKLTNLFTEHPFVLLVLIISIIAAVIIVERYLALRFRFSIDGRQLFNEIKKYIAVNDQRRALEACRQYPLVPLAQVLAAGVQNIDKSMDEVDMAMETETLYYVPKVNERLLYLPSLANTATLVGLLGTIVGLIVAFGASSSSEVVNGMTKEQALAQGVSYAMYTTAAALSMAIPTVLAAMWLGSKANKIIDDMDHYAAALKHLIHKKKSGSPIDGETVDRTEAIAAGKAVASKA